MTRVFVTGATGLIGEQVALALRAAGHEVHGLVRNEQSPIAKNLVQNEVHLVVGDLTKPDTYTGIAEISDVIIHTAVDYTQFDTVDQTAVDALITAAGKRGNKRTTFIYTSGVLVYPNSNQDVKSEDDATDPNALPFLLGRIQREKNVIASSTVHGVVLRPGFVWGKRSPHFASYFKSAHEGKVVVEGADIIWSQIHIDDLANAYLKIAEAAPNVVGGQIFNITDDARSNNLQIAKRLSSVAGYKGEIEQVPNNNPFFGKSVIADYKKATRLVGWVPKHRTLVDDAETFYKSWKARQH